MSQALIYEKMSFDGQNLAGRDLSHSQFLHCTFRGTNLTGVDFEAADLRWSDFTAANLTGTNFYAAMLEGAILDDVITDDTTRWLKMYCPETGPFIGYKKGFNHCLIQLLIPADAKRSSATRNSCRCSKAKVLAIYDPLTLERYREAQSYADPDFIYRVGQWIEPDKYTEDRFIDSTHGIHFWMSREEALGYL